MLLALVMVFGMMPLNVFATETEEMTSAAEAPVAETAESAAAEVPVTENAEPAAEEAPVTETTEPAETEAPAVPEETEATEAETEPAETEAPTLPEEEVEPVTEELSDPAMQEVAEEPVAVEVAPVLQTVVPEVDHTNEDMFHMYLDRQFFGESAATLGTGGYDNLPEGAVRNLYNYLKSALGTIADNGGSTEFRLNGESFANIGFKTSFALEDVGLEAWPGQDDEAGKSALLSKFLIANDLSDGTIVDALMADCPYELYWYDKTVGFTFGFGWSYISADGTVKVELTSFVIRFSVAQGYGSSYVVNGAAATTAAEAADYARQVASQQKKGSDYETLEAYKDWILDAVDYNDAAAGPTYPGGYGDPWQLIYVFDGNPNTMVVCEGYAKAFQYLCDLALQEGYLSDETACYLAMGTMTDSAGDGGPHMWNIVSLEGKKYLVDVTNSEADGFGGDGTLFLAGVTGSMDEGYTFTNSNGATLNYVYSVTENNVTSWPSKEAYGNGAETILTLEASSYEPVAGDDGGQTPSEPTEGMTEAELNTILGQTSGWYTLTGDVTITGTVTIPAGAALAMDSSTIVIDGGSLVVSAGAGLNPYNESAITVRNGGRLVFAGPVTDDSGNVVLNQADLGISADSMVTIETGATLDNNGALDVGGTLTVQTGATYIHGDHAALMENGRINGIARNLIDRFESACVPEEIFAGLDNLRKASGDYKRRILFINNNGRPETGETIEINEDLNIPEGILVRIGTYRDITTNLVINGTLHIQNDSQVQIYGGGTLTVNQLNNWGQLYVSGDGSAYTNRSGMTLGNMVTFEQFTQANFEKDLQHHFNANAGYVLTEELTLTDDLTIRTGWGQSFLIGTGGKLIVPAGKTLTVRESEMVLFGEGKMIVDGTLILAEDANLDDGDESGYLVVDEQGELTVNSSGNTIPAAAVGMNVTTGAKVNGIEKIDLLGMFFAGNAESAEADIYAALAQSGTYAQVNAYLFTSATLHGEGEQKRLTIPENAYLILHTNAEPTVATIPAGTVVENNGLIIIRENCSVVVEAGATLKNNFKINNFGALHLDAAECLISGEAGIVQNNAPIISGSEGTKPYLSYTWVDNWGDGFFENVGNGGKGDLGMAGGDTMNVLFYLNSWNSERMVWEKTPVIPKSGDTGKLSAVPVNGQIRQGETNAPYFVTLTAKGWAPEGITLSVHDVATGTDVTTTVYISRNVAGFYREQPVLFGENKMTEEQLRDIYMSYLEIDPADPETWEFYFALDCYWTSENGITVPFLPKAGFPVISDGAQFASIQAVDANVYKITIDPEVAQNKWQDRSFQFLQVVCEARASVVEGEIYQDEIFYGNLSVRTKEVSEAAACFWIDDTEYRVLRQGVYMQWSDHGPVLVDLPAGISYDLETNTMTLNGAYMHHLQFSYHWEHEGNSGTHLPSRDLTLKLMGENTIEAFYTEAMGLYGGVNLTITGSGSLYVKADNGDGHEDEDGPYGFDAVNLGEDSTLTIDSGTVTAEIAGKAYYRDEQSGQVLPRNLAAIRGNGATLTVNGGSLTTVVPQGARSDIYNEIEDRNEDVGYSGLEHFRSITVNGGKLDTTTVDMHRDDQNGWRGTYTQTGGTVIIDALARMNYGHLERWDEDAGQNVYWKDGYSYYYAGLDSWGDVNISGGDLTILVQPAYAERSEESYFGGISMRGSQLNISGDANIVIDSSVADQKDSNDNNPGTGVELADAHNDRGDHIGTGSMVMTGGSLTMDTPGGFWNEFLSMSEDASVRITGGKLYSRNNRSDLRGDVYIGGNAQWDLVYCEVNAENRFELNGDAVMNFNAGSWFNAWKEVQIHSGTMNFGSLSSNEVSIFHSYSGDANIHGGTLNFNNGSLLVHNSMNVHGGTINITHNTNMEPTDAYNPFWECYAANSRPFALLVKAYLAIHGGSIHINVASDQYAGITNWGNYHQMGGSVTVNGNVNGIAKTTGKAMYDIGNATLQNNSVLNLYGDVAYHQSPAEESTLLVTDDASLNAYGKSVGLQLEGNAKFNGSSSVRAFAQGIPVNGVAPQAVKITENQIRVDGGIHTFQTGIDAYTGAIGLAIYDNAKVVVNNGQIHVDAAIPVSSYGTENRLDQNAPYLIMDRTDGDKLSMQPASAEQSDLYVLKDATGNDSGTYVTIYGTLSCGNMGGWNIEEDHETDESGQTTKVRTRLVIGGKQYLHDWYDMSHADPGEWTAPEWYRYKDFITHIYVGGVWNLPKYIFGHMDHVTHIDIEKTVTEIDDNAFAGCTSLRAIRYDGTQAQWNSAFHGTLPEGCVVSFGNNGEDSYYPAVGVTYLDKYDWGWTEEQTYSNSSMRLGVGDAHYVIFYHNITSTTEVPDGEGGTRTVTVLQERVPIHPDNLVVSDPGKLKLQPIMAMENELVAKNERYGEYFVCVSALEGWDSVVNISCTLDGTTVDFPVEIGRSSDGFYTGAVSSNETWINHFWMNPLMTDADRTFYFVLGEGRKLRPAEGEETFVWIYQGADHLESWGPVEGSDNAYRFTLKQDVVNNAMNEGTNFELAVSYDVVDDDGNLLESGTTAGLWFHSGFGEGRKAAFEINGGFYEYYKTDKYEGFIQDGQAATLPDGMSFQVDDSNQCVNLTLQDVYLESLQMNHTWIERDEWGNIRYDENGNPISRVDLPYENLNILLKGSNTIESSERTALELTGNLKVNISSDEYGYLELRTYNRMDCWNEACRIADETELTISGNANVWVQVDGEAPDFLAAIRGCETGRLVLTDNARLETVVLPGSYERDHRGLERFASITVEENACLMTQGLILNASWELGTENAAEFIQTGGEVFINGHMNRHNDGHVHVPGIFGRYGSLIRVTGGRLIINTMPEGDGEYNAENYSFTGISSEGGTIEIGGDALVAVNGWYSGEAIQINGWGDEKGVFRMSGGTLNTFAHGEGFNRALNIDWGTDAQITGGTLNLNGVNVNVCSDLTISGDAVLNIGCQVHIDNRATVNLEGGEINFQLQKLTDENNGNLYSAGAMNLHPGSTFNLNGGELTVNNGAFYLGGEFHLNGGTLNVSDGEIYADNLLNVNGGQLNMRQNSQYLYHVNREEMRPFQSQLEVNGVLNLNSGNISLHNVYVNVNHQLNLNGGIMNFWAAARNRDQRAENSQDDEWQVAMRVNEHAQMNVRDGASFTMHTSDFETILEVYGDYEQTGGYVSVNDDVIDLHAFNTIVLAKGGNISGGSLTANGGQNGILVHFSHEDERTHNDGSKLVISGDAIVDINAVEAGINMARPVVISGGKVDIDIDSIQYEEPDYQQYVQCGYGILATGQETNSSLTISGGTVNITVPTVFDESLATNADYAKYTDLMGIFGWKNSININGGVVHITAADSLVTRNDTFQDLLNIVGMNVIDNANGNVLQEVYGSYDHPDRGTMYFRTFQSDNVFGSEDPDIIYDAADSITIASAASGNGTHWTYDGQTKTLKIYGSGQMNDYASPNATPWNRFVTNIQNVEIAEGVTSIGNYAFAGCSSVREISLPKSVDSIGAGAFQGTSGLTVKVYHNTAAEEYVKSHNLGLAYLHTTEELVQTEGSNLYRCELCDYVQIGQISEQTPAEEILGGLILTEDDTQTLKEEIEAALQDPSDESNATADMIAALDEKIQQETDLTVEVQDESNALNAPEGAEAPSIVGAAMNADSNTTTVSLVIDPAEAGVTTENISAPAGLKPLTVFTMTLQKTQVDAAVEMLQDLKIPVTITLPIPASIRSSSLKVLHYADGTDQEPEVITPAITADANGNRYAVFVVSGFSTYALAVPKVAPEPVSYSYGQNVQIKLIEPWGIRANAKISTSAGVVDYSSLYDYGVYFIRKSALDRAGLTQSTITVADIVNDADAQKQTKADGVTISSGYLSAIYDSDIYTYELDDSVFVMFYFVTEEGADPIYVPVRERNLKTLAQQRMNDAASFPNALERDVYKKMVTLEADVTDYRSDFTSLSTPEKQKAPTLAQYPLGAQAAGSQYTYGQNAQIKLIEPWGLKANVKVSRNGSVINYNAVEEYGLVVLADNSKVYNTAAEILENENAYVFSSKNGDASISSGYISATYSKDIYTYQLNTDIYVFGYVKDADGYHYGPVRNRNVYELMMTRKDDAAGFPNGKERTVYADMIDLYNAITLYREDYFNN